MPKSFRKNNGNIMIPSANTDAITADNWKRDFDVALFSNKRAILLEGMIKPPIPGQNPWMYGHFWKAQQ